ncbi:unnamed protein product [Urochloa humidicola]
MARPPTMVIQDDYIDMDLTPAATPMPPSSPRFEFQSTAAGGAKHREPAFASPADELFYKGNLLPLHLPPRLQLVQRLLQEQQPAQALDKREAEQNATAEGGDVAGKACAAKKPSWAKKLKVVKRWASREYIRSFFLARPAASDIAVDGGGAATGNGIGSVSARGSVLEQEEVCHHRKSFSGIIRRVRLVATTKAPGTSPLCSSSSSSSSSTPSCGNANGFFFRPPASAAAAAATPALKRSSSAGSEEGAIQGAIAHCKRSQLLQPGMVVSARRSVSDVMFYSVTNTPRASSVAAGEVAQERRQEMCRG